VSIQAQVVNLMDDLQQELGLTYVIIAHDLSVVRHVSDRIAVMYLGKIVELADRTSLYESPMHPYTKALMSAVPVPDTKRRGQKSERILLRGDVPSPIAPPSGCRFHTRCWKATQICKTTEPQLVELKPGQRVACHHPENFADQAPQDTVLLSAAKAASELVPDAVVSDGSTEKEPAKAEKEPAKAEPAEAEPAKAEATKAEPAKAEVAEAEKEPAEAEKEPAKTEPAKAEKEPAKAEKEPAKAEKKPAKAEPAKSEPAKSEPAKAEPAKSEPAKAEPAKAEPAKSEPAKSEAAKSEPAKSEAAKSEPAKSEAAKAEAADEPAADASDEASGTDSQESTGK
jgi:peptide/nickel transport system ATP-binding protein